VVQLHSRSLQAVKVLGQDQFLRTKLQTGYPSRRAGAAGASDTDQHILQSSKVGWKFDKRLDFVAGLNMASPWQSLCGVGRATLVPVWSIPYKRDRHGRCRSASNLSGFGRRHAPASFGGKIMNGHRGWASRRGAPNTAHHPVAMNCSEAAWDTTLAQACLKFSAKGAANTFGLEWDEHAKATAPASRHPNMRQPSWSLSAGGAATFVKNFGKQGSCTKPYAFGFIGHCARGLVRRATSSQETESVTRAALSRRFNVRG